MNIISHYCSAELDIKKSRFLAEAFPVATQEEARALVKSQKELHFGATHVVHAFVIGATGGILGCSDDGEPSGTAGRPSLEVLKGSGVTNILVTVSRWFGGTLLGTGGLVKAYSEAVKSVLSLCPVEELVSLSCFSVTVSYEVYDRIRREIENRKIEVVSEEFGTEIHITGRIRESLQKEFCARIIDLTSGQSSVVLAEESQTALQT